MIVKKLASLLDAPVHPHVFGVMRVGMGLILFQALRKSAQELLRDVYFASAFYVPFFDWMPVPSRSLFALLLALRVLLAALMVVGVWSRPATFVSGALGLYVVLLDRLQFHNNRYSLALYLLLLGFAPVHRSASLFAATPPADERWPIGGGALAKLQLALIYVGSAGSKLLDPDWRDGTVLAVRFVHGQAQAIALGVPRALMETLASPLVSSVLARAAISTELFLVFALFLRRLRIPALWIGCMFHLLIEVTARVESFTWLTLAMYGLFVTHDVEARTLHFDGEDRRARVLARLLRLTDWLRRYRVVAWSADEVRGKHSVVITRRDGSRATGFAAWVMAARTLPLLFPLWAPLALIQALRPKR